MSSDAFTPDLSDRGLEVRGASKRFGATVALDDVGLKVTTGEVRALMGANGSGKSTLIKALAGYHLLDDGEVSVNGQELRLSHLGDDAKAAGLRFVHQDLALIPTLSVAENLALERGFPLGRTGAIDRQSLKRWAAERMSSVGIDVDPALTIDQLGPVEKTMVAIARALDDVDPTRNIILLDEPTARLPADDADRLMGSLEALRTLGLPIVYVTHRLDEVYRMAGTVTVLRDGLEVYEGSLEGLAVDQLKSLLIGEGDPSDGRTQELRSASTGPADQRSVLSLRQVSTQHLKDIDLEVFAGEIVAITGLIGSGRSELGRVIYGLQPYEEGQIDFAGTTTAHLHSDLMFRPDIGYTPQDRIAGLL